MAKLKRTPKQQMKYWWIGRLKIRARTARVAYRKYLRGNYVHDCLIRDLELDNPCGSIDKSPAEAGRLWTTLNRSLQAEARARMSSAKGSA